jgi:hypothetical protein
MLAPAAEALAFAHSKGATHERVTPQSFFLAQGRILKVLDFGVARALYPTARDKEGGGLFAVSAALLPYMAPEQLDSTHGPIGPATDVYALALLVLELLCDRPAMEASPGTDLATRITDPNERPTQGLLWTSIPTETEAVLARAVALKPEDRQRDAREFWDELTASVPGSELAARAPGPVTLPDAMGPLPPPRPPPPPPLNPRDEPVVTSKVGAGERAAEAEARAAKEARDRDSGRQTIRQISPPVHDADFEPDSMEGEPVRKAVGPLLPPSVTPFSHDPSIIVRSMPPPPPPPQAAPPPAPVPPVASRRAPTMIVRRPPAETVKLERVPEDAPSAAWKYIVVVMLTAGVVVGGAYGVRAFLAWRADRAAASADVDAAPVVAAPVDAASSAPSVDAIDANVAAMDAGPHPFDLDVARQALDLVAPSLADCKVPKGKPPLKVKVIFAPDGTVTAAYPLPQWQGLTPAICMARRLKEAHVPPFKGLPGTVTYLAARP